MLFTDVVDFTARTAGRSAEETADFLNHHLRLVTDCVEAEAGMVDKFIGDAVMALWNAIEDQADHGARAVRRRDRDRGCDPRGQPRPRSAGPGFASVCTAGRSWSATSAPRPA